MTESPARPGPRGSLAGPPRGAARSARRAALRLTLGMAVSLLAGLMLSVLVAVAAGLKILPRGAVVTEAHFIMDGGHEFGSGWKLTIDEACIGETCRSTSLVAPQSYGVGGFGFILDLHDEAAVASDGGAIPRRAAPGDAFDDIPEFWREEIRTGSAGGGTLIIWPFEIRVGWPIRCMRYWIDGAYGWNRSGYTITSPQVRRGWVAGRSPRGSLHERVVPFEPIWSGLFASTLLYGAACFTAGLLAGRIRAGRRRRAGRCVACGHHLGGADVCPECGAGYAAPGASPETLTGARGA